MLNILWAGFFLVAFLAALGQTFNGTPEIWNELVAVLFSSSKTAFSIALNLTGILCLWMGLLKIAELSGLTLVLAKLLRPLFRRIFPEVPSDSPAFGSIIMNIGNTSA